MILLRKLILINTIIIATVTNCASAKKSEFNKIDDSSNHKIDKLDTSKVQKQEKYYLKPNSQGQFTQEMIVNAIDAGHNYIVFDAKEWRVYYQNSKPYKKTGWNYQIHLEKILWGELERFITLDFSKVHIDCFQDNNNILKNNTVFLVDRSRNIEFKFGKVTGDKYKRSFKVGKGEDRLESTHLMRSVYGSVNITITEAKNISGFMGDMYTGNGYGVKHIVWDPKFKKQKNRSYQTDYYDIDQSKTDDGSFAMIGGVGYNRLLKLDMFNVTYKFKDKFDNDLGDLKSEYLKIEYFPKNATKIAINTTAIDGRNDKITKFGFQLVYRPSRDLMIQNSYMYDFGRGSVSNLGTNLLIKNNVFENTENYSSKPEFRSSTKYGIDLEDAISKYARIEGNKFINKFHSILVTDAIEIDIINNQFKDNTYNIKFWRVLKGNIYGNTMKNGVIDLGKANEDGNIKYHNNQHTDSNLILTNAGEFYDNSISGGKLTGGGYCHNNTFTDVNYRHCNWKNVTDNTFNESYGYYKGEPIVGNTFNNSKFQFNSTEGKTITFTKTTFNGTYKDGVTFQVSFPFDKVIFDNCKLNNIKIKHRIVNKPELKNEGSYYFVNCKINIDTLFAETYNNKKKSNVKFYFKDCIIKGKGVALIEKKLYSNVEIVMDNCTVQDLKLPDYVKYEKVSLK